MDAKPQSPSRHDLAIKVSRFFLILSSEDFLAPLRQYSEQSCPTAKCIAVATEGLHSTISAAGLPFQLIQNSTLQRKFDQFHGAERIRGMKTMPNGLPESTKRNPIDSAKEKMSEFLASEEGRDFTRDHVLYELNSLLDSHDVTIAAQELLVQTLISTWSVFESFARSFIITWLNEEPSRASSIRTSQDLKAFLGKQVIDFQTIDEHGFDLSNSMGTIIFGGRRLDNLGIIRGAMKALFSSAKVQKSLGEGLWALNQKRHLFVHKRGIVDTDYLSKTGACAALGERLALESDDIEEYLKAVRDAIIVIGDAAMKENESNR